MYEAQFSDIYGQLAVDELTDEHPELKIEAGTNNEVAAKADVVF